MLVIESSDTGYVVWKHSYPQKVWLFNTEEEVIRFRNGFFGIFEKPEPIWVYLTNASLEPKTLYDFTTGGYDG